MAFKKHRGSFERVISGPEHGLESGESYTLILNIPTAEQMDRPVVERVPAAVPGGFEFKTNGVIAGWSGVNDDDRSIISDVPLEFNAANLYDFLSDAPIRGAVIREVNKLYGEALSGELLRKNSKAPQSGGSAAREPRPASGENPPSDSAAGAS